MEKWQPKLIACVIGSALYVYFAQYSATHPWWTLAVWPGLAGAAFWAWYKIQSKK